jgi:hypothetical protein
MEIEAGSIASLPDDQILHPRDKPVHISATWTKDGLEIKGGNIVIPANDATRLFRVWADWVPSFVQREAAEHGIEDAYERAFIAGTLRAFHDVFDVVPSEAEMQRGSSVLSRKMNLFYSFARELYIKARSEESIRRNTFFRNELAAMKMIRTSRPEDKKKLYRTLLHAYVSRVCDVNLDDVEKIENVMRRIAAPRWEQLVEGVYDIETVLKAYQAVKQELPQEPDDQVVNSITAHFIESAVIEEFPFGEGGGDE